MLHFKWQVLLVPSLFCFVLFCFVLFCFVLFCFVFFVFKHNTAAPRCSQVYLMDLMQSLSMKPLRYDSCFTSLPLLFDSLLCFFSFPPFQAIEVSSLIPLKYGVRKCIMVGDPNQLPATVVSHFRGGARTKETE